MSKTIKGACRQSNDCLTFTGNYGNILCKFSLELGYELWEGPTHWLVSAMKSNISAVSSHGSVEWQL